MTARDIVLEILQKKMGRGTANTICDELNIDTLEVEVIEDMRPCEELGFVPTYMCVVINTVYRGNHGVRFVGFSKRNPNDEYNRNIGIRLAASRAFSCLVDLI